MAFITIFLSSMSCGYTRPLI